MERTDVNHCPQVEPVFDDVEVHPFRELMEDTGLLWLINRTVFHPRGYALALVFGDDDRQEPLGWQIVGNGTQVWLYDPAQADNEAERFRSVAAFFAQLSHESECLSAIDEALKLGLIEIVRDDDPPAQTVGLGDVDQHQDDDGPNRTVEP